jgi:hypothetical protein
MVRAILSIIFDNKDGCIFPVRRMGNSVDELTERVIVTGYLEFWRIQMANVCAERSGVIHHQADYL